MSHLLFYILILISLPAFSQKKWDGGGGNTLWNDPLNWNDNIIPSPPDDVILDNSIVTGNYAVVLPVTAVTVNSVLINPSSFSQIELTLPKENTVVPALTITGPGYGLTINKGGTFRNSSGASSGTPVTVADSIKINNEGRFIINTPRAHATNVDRISRMSGTEKGIVEFDIPDASTTISLSGRTYGSLVLKSTALGRALNYTAAGTNKVIIRSDLEVGDSVNFNLNFSDSILIKGNLIQGYSSFNLGNTARNVVVAVSGNITQHSGGIITETGTGIQQLLLNGVNEQQLNMNGQINNQVILIKDGAANAKLLSRLSLPYSLQLKRGNIIVTENNLLILQADCTIKADTLSDQSFIDGPLRKMGLSGSNFLFPVGKANKMRWVELLAASGNFTVEYNRSSPRIISNVLGAGIDHISAIEYWEITGDGNAMVKLSFNDPGSGGVTDLSQLRTTRLQNNIWQNAGNIDFRGTPGSNGWVSSSAASGFSAENNFFALASAIGQENPLPVFFLGFKVSVSRDETVFNWKVSRDHPAIIFELQESDDNKHYTTIYSCTAIKGLSDYTYTTKSAGSKYYRVKAVDIDGSIAAFSKINYLQQKEKILTMNTINISNNLNLRVIIKETRRVEFIIHNSAGHTMKKLQMDVHKGTTDVTILINDLSAGVYTLSMMAGNDQLSTFRFIKQ